MKVEIYTSPTCGYCHQAKALLKQLGAPFAEYDVSRDREAAQRIVQLTGQMGVPVIVIDGQVIIGFDRTRIERLITGNCNGHNAKLGLKVADARRFSGHEGAYVGVVEGGSAGERAGIKAGDTIVSIDSDRIGTAAELEQLMKDIRPGSLMTVVFIRNDKAQQTRLIM